MRKTPAELSEGPQNPAGALTQYRVISSYQKQEGTIGTIFYLLDCSGETVSRPLKK